MGRFLGWLPTRGKEEKRVEHWLAFGCTEKEEARWANRRKRELREKESGQKGKKWETDKSELVVFFLSVSFHLKGFSCVLFYNFC